MDAKEKQVELDKLMADSSEYNDAVQLKQTRVYEAIPDVFIKFHDVATADKFLGFVAVAIPNPKLPADEQLEALVELYGDSTIVKSCLNAVAIKMQQDCRKSMQGDRKITQSEFDSRFNALDQDVLQRLKTMEYIRKHIEEEWKASLESTQNGDIRLF